MRSTLKDMSTEDPAIIDRNLKNYTFLVEHWRVVTPGQENPAVRLYSDALEYWREKKARLELGDTVEVHAGKRWASFLRATIDKEEKRIVGTWNWWNGYTVTFNENGGASYRGSSLVQSGVGRWQNTGGNTYHVHWLQSKTDDYFTLSFNGMKLEGKYDGKPGVSTRKC
ncbi:MAG TPA: hypothetical protein VFO29_04940 [Candidatus Rubrimentiphilum sp.]|nr:hypothetical protein [Candidatus Rubrimentiphilum sp.]